MRCYTTIRLVVGNWSTLHGLKTQLDAVLQIIRLLRITVGKTVHVNIAGHWLISVANYARTELEYKRCKKTYRASRPK